MLMVAGMAFGAPYEELELNRVYGDPVFEDRLTVQGALVACDGLTVSNGITSASTDGGTGVVSTAVATSSDVGNLRQTTITVDDLAVPIGFGGTGTNHVGGAKVFVFPEGRILVHGITVANVTMATNTAITAAEGGDYSCGTTIGVTTGLVTTAVNLCPKTSIDPWTNIVSASLASSAQFDGTSTAVEMYYNLEVDTGDLTAPSTAYVDSATFVISWTPLGDY